MIVGTIRTKDVLMHPVAVASLIGIRGLIRLIRLGLSSRPTTFLAHVSELLAVPPACGHPECLAEFRSAVSEKIR